MFCIAGASYTQLCDVITKVSNFNPVSYEIVDEWVPDENRTGVRCSAQSFTAGGIRGSGTLEVFDTDEYRSTDYVRIKTPVALTKSDQVTNIRSRNGNLIWIEEEFDGRPTIFNVDGCAPVASQLTGEAVEYVSILSRVSVQEEG